ncbi:MAG: lipoate--protein ligase [Anaerofustis stercorihominis]|nr:lipoate--protein ligase [Anaerofustis stercorihominis]
MKYIQTAWDIPYYNMALEEYLMQSDKFTDDYLFFYIHKPSVIIGKYQNAMSEVDIKYLRENDIILARRISGGGAVYHDEGNLNFSFICRKKSDTIDFRPFVEPIAKALLSLGVNASLSGRNDLLLDGKKIGGNAQHISGGKVLSHGTILADVDMEKMTNALSVDPEKYKSRGIKSVRSRVTNISDYLGRKTDAYELREHIVSELRKDTLIQIMDLSDEDINEVEKRVKEKFSLWEYNYGGRTSFSTTNKKKYPAGLIELSYNAKAGIITDISVSGDFFANGPVENLYERLIGCPLKYDAVSEALEGDDTISGLSKEELIELILY